MVQAFVFVGDGLQTIGGGVGKLDPGGPSQRIVLVQNGGFLAAFGIDQLALVIVISPDGLAVGLGYFFQDVFGIVGKSGFQAVGVGYSAHKVQVTI